MHPFSIILSYFHFVKQQLEEDLQVCGTSTCSSKIEKKIVIIIKDYHKMYQRDSEEIYSSEIKYSLGLQVCMLLQMGHFKLIEPSISSTMPSTSLRFSEEFSFAKLSGIFLRTCLTLSRIKMCKVK